MTTARILAVAVDCRRPDLLAAFWAEALGHGETRTWTDSHGLTYRQLDLGDGPALLFQPVPEGKTGKNRLHLDLAPEGRDQRAEVERLVLLGAKVLDDPPDDPWIVLADPEGNEFCVLPPR
ncbi:VOC family protein [Amycolatopsis sp. FBCC-B4732]|uniref:VOC family protein n=1 Tax=unclassified Amycolatopsis TaxID=2618356 RepID=UPI001FF2256C|nr:VOC family protein [Amycolatopsis sp. FBCC-B4732]UOX92317.1 VOC family protein [Amycolatopsis sp. FBCC-B4732]